jgi:hypothetical protein
MSGGVINVEESSALTVADISSVYGGGSLVNIGLEKLVGNETAIQQLMNEHNHQAQKRTEAERKLADKESEIEFLKTSPFMSVIGLIVGACGALVMSIGVNLLTSDKPPEHAASLTYIGFGLVLFSGIANALYPFARRMFNWNLK